VKKPKVCEHGVVSPHICKDCVDEFSANFHLGVEGDALREELSVAADIQRDGPELGLAADAEILEHILSPDQFTGYCVGSAIVCLSKMESDYEGNGLRKAIGHLLVLQDYLAGGVF